MEQKKAVSPFVLTDEMYIKEWESVIFEGMDMASNPQEIFTERGEQVRSKSEKIIADSLYRNGIPTDMNILFICVEWELSTRILSACM